MSPDPYSGSYDITNPQSFNRYVYAENNPVGGVDPSGLDDCEDDNGGIPPGWSFTPSGGVGGSGLICYSYSVDSSTDGGVSSQRYNYCSYVGGSGNSGGGGGGGGGGGSNPSKPPAPNNLQKCTAAQQAAAKLASSLDSVSTSTGWIAFGAGVATAVSGAGEGVTFGIDTPMTISFASITGFFGTASTITSVGAAALNSFAAGNTAAIHNFAWGRLANVAFKASASLLYARRVSGDPLPDSQVILAGVSLPKVRL